jgi:hypothetical protein
LVGGTAGWVLFNATSSKPDLNGMIDGTCNGAVVFMFSRDIEEGAKPIADAQIMKSGA